MTGDIPADEGDPAEASGAVGGFEGEAMTTYPAPGSMVISDSTASAGKALAFWTIGTTSIRTTLSAAADRVIVRAHGSYCSGWPQMIVKVDGVQVLSTTVTATSWADYGAGVSLAAGARSVSITFPTDAYSRGVCDRNLYVDKVTFTAPAGGGSGTGTGLVGQYFDNRDFTGLELTRTDPTVNFDWGSSSPDPSIGVDTFSVRWTGKVQPRYSETYTFYTVSDDGVRLRVNGSLLVDNWTDHAATQNQGTISLTAGQQVDIALDFYENGGLATAQLAWSSASQAKEIVPQSQLYGADAPPPPPPPTGERGLAVVRYGDSTMNLDHKELYGVCIHGTSQSPGAVNLPCKSLIYTAAADTVNAGWGFWRPWQRAYDSGWLLEDASGNLIVDPGFGAYLADIGLPEVQQDWIDNVKAWLAAHPGTEGVFIDNVVRNIGGLSGGHWPARYPTQQAWDDAMVSFIAAVGPALHASGYYVMTNDDGWYGGNPACNSGQCTREWWPRLSPYVDSHFFEHYTRTASSDVLRIVGADSWQKFWYEHASLVELAQSLGDEIVANDTHSLTDVNAMTYHRASFLLFWDGGPGSWSSYSDGYGNTDPWNDAWTVDAGVPVAARVALANGMYTREYSKAKIYVNPTAASQVTDGMTFASGTARIVVK